MADQTPTCDDSLRLPWHLCALSVLAFFLLLPTTNAATLAVLFIAPFATVFTLVAGWIFGKYCMLAAAAISVLITAVVVLRTLFT